MEKNWAYTPHPTHGTVVESPMMSKAFTLLTLYGLLAFPQVATHAEDRSGAVAVRIEGASSCATGIAFPSGTILTNAHVSRSVCRFGDCSLITRVSDEGENEIFPTRKHRTLTLIRELPSVDIATLSISTVGQHEPTPFSPPQIGEEIVIRGFPHCADFSESRGRITSITEPFFETDAPVSKGSSGSMVLGLDGQLRGVVTSVSSVPSAIGATLLGTEGNATAISWSSINEILSLGDYQMLEWELRMALSYYDKAVFPESGTRRWMRTLRFLTLVDGIAGHAATADNGGDVVRPLLWSSTEDVSFVSAPPTPHTPLGLLAEELAFTFLWEYGGPRGVTLSTDPVDLIETLRTQQQRTGPEIEVLRRRAEEVSAQQFPGFVLQSIMYGLVLVGIASSWVLSLGFVLGRSNPFSRAILHSVLVGLLFWPLSFLVYLWWHRRSKSSLR